MRFRSRKTLKREFLESRTRQSDSDFLAGCGMAGESAGNAIKVRAAIANLAGVDAEDVRAEDRFESDLVHSDFWGSLDTIAIVLELEECLGIQIADELAIQIVNPETVPGVTVADFVRSVLRAVQAP